MKQNICYTCNSKDNTSLFYFYFLFIYLFIIFYFFPFIHYIESLFELISLWLCMSRLGVLSLANLVSQVIGLLMSWTTDLLLFKVSSPCVTYKIK